MSNNTPLTEEPEGGFSAKAKAIAVTPKVTGGISILCSAYLIYYIVSDPRRRSLTYQRLVGVLCLCDLASSFGIFLSTWPLPEGNNFGAMYEGEPDGSNALCTAQGALIHWGITTALANVFLSTHFLLVVKFRFTETYLKRMEPFYIATIFLLGFICIAIPLSMNLYGYNPYSRNIWCFIFVPPEDCEDEADCIRLTVVLRWALFFGPLWFCLLLCLALMMTLYCIVKRIEAAAVRWRSTSWTTSLSAPTQWPTAKLIREQQRQNAKDFRQTRRVARQAVLYGISFIVVWLPLLVLNTFNLVRKTWFNPEEPNGFVVLWAVMFFQPLQGVLNLVIYRKFGVVRAVSSIPRRVSSFVSSRVSTRSPSLRYGQSTSNASDLQLAAAAATSELLKEERNLSNETLVEMEEMEGCNEEVWTINPPIDDPSAVNVARNAPKDEDVTIRKSKKPRADLSSKQACVVPFDENLDADTERNVRFASKEFVHEVGNGKDKEQSTQSYQRKANVPSESALESSPPVTSETTSLFNEEMEKMLEKIYGDYESEQFLTEAGEGDQDQPARFWRGKLPLNRNRSEG